MAQSHFPEYSQNTSTNLHLTGTKFGMSIISFKSDHVTFAIAVLCVLSCYIGQGQDEN